MKHATTIQQLQVWQAFLIEETWLMLPYSDCLDDILDGSAPPPGDKVNPNMHPGDLDALIQAATVSGDVQLIDAANRCAALGNLYMNTFDLSEGKQVRPVLATLH